MRRMTVAAVVVCVAASAPLAAQDEAQGFLRVVEGAASLIRVEDGQAEAARENLPVLSGDRLSLSPGSRVEVILPDTHRLRLAESAELELTALARSLDEDRAGTALLLTNGALAIDVPREAVDRTRVDTDSAGVLLEPGGLYLVEIDGRGDTRVVVRAGEAEILGQYDSTVVRAGDEAVVPRDSRDQIALYEAPPLTDVEEWARQLEAEASRVEEVRYVEPELRYAAQPLSRYGSWVDGGAGYAWRPRVASGWRPYYQGYWTPSPAGLVWSSYEPWGWVPYHYGSWDLHPSYGWLWYPGRVYRPAHVVWYWGPSYAGWVPSGYYGSFYARRFGFHFSFGSGFYGVSHASWHAYRDWVFCPTRSLGFRHQYRYHGDHRVLAHRDGWRGSDRAFITSDTRGFDRERWADAGAVEEVIGRRAHRRTGSGAADLPDVSAVVARSPEVSDRMLRDIDSRGGGDGRGGDGGGRVAVHRPSGPRGADGQNASQSFDTDEGRRTREGLRRPVVGDDGVTRQAPAGGADGGPHRSPVARPRGEREQPAAADAGVPTDRDGPRDRALVRSRASSGLEVDGAGRSTPAAPVDRSRAAQPRVLRRDQGTEEARDSERPSPRDRSMSVGRGEAPGARTARSPRPYPGASSEQAAPGPRDRVRGAVDRSVPTQQTRVDRARPEVQRPEVQRVAPGQERAVRQRPAVDRTAPESQVRAYRDRPTVERAAPQPQARVYRDRPTVERAAPQPQARLYRERPTVERAGPQSQARVYRERPTVERVAPQPQAYRERPSVQRSAPAPPTRAYRDRPTVQRAAPQPQARVYRERPSVERAAPPPQARMERSYSSGAMSPAPRASRESRAPAQASAPARAPRAESSRAAPVARESSRSEGSGAGGGRGRESGAQSRGGGGGGGGRAHARGPR